MCLVHPHGIYRPWLDVYANPFADVPCAGLAQWLQLHRWPLCLFGWMVWHSRCGVHRRRGDDYDQMIWSIHEHSMYHFLEMFVFTFEIFETLEGICQYDQYVSLGCNKSHGAIWTFNPVKRRAKTIHWLLQLLEVFQIDMSWEVWEPWEIRGLYLWCLPDGLRTKLTVCWLVGSPRERWHFAKTIFFQTVSFISIIIIIPHYKISYYTILYHIIPYYTIINHIMIPSDHTER